MKKSIVICSIWNLDLDPGVQSRSDAKKNPDPDPQLQNFVAGCSDLVFTMVLLLDGSSNHRAYAKP